MEQFTGQQQRQANLQATELANQEQALKLQQTQAMSAALQEEYSKDEPTPTQGGFTPEGQVTSPTISFLEKQVKAAGKAGNLSQYKDSIKMLEDARNKESEIQKRNSEINKDVSERKAAAAQYALDNKDIEGGLAIMSKYDPVGAMRLYAALPKDATGKIAYSPQLEQMLKKTVAENSTLKEMEEIKAKKLAEQDKENYRQESLDIRREATADRRAEQAARREERIAAREEKTASKSADYKAASRQADSAHARYQRRYDSLKKSLRSAATEDEKKVIISDMEDLNTSYEEEKTMMRQEWADKGLKVKWPGEAKPSLDKSSVGSSKEKPMEISSEEEASKLPKGTWIKMGNRVGKVK